MPELADMMLERTRNGSWVVVFKALISTHNLLVLGNEVGRGRERGVEGHDVVGHPLLWHAFGTSCMLYRPTSLLECGLLIALGWRVDYFIAQGWNVDYYSPGLESVDYL